MKIRFISDPHLFHSHVIRFSEWGHSVWEKDNDGNLLFYGKKYAQPDLPKTGEEWNEKFRINWNSVVGNKDITYILGDMSMDGKADPKDIYDFVMTLNGKILFVPGNHDRDFIKFMKKEHPSDKKIEILDSIVRAHIQKENGEKAWKVILCHYPLFSYDGCGVRDTIHLYGHIHNNYPQMKAYHEVLKQEIWTSTDSPHQDPTAYNVGCMLPWINFTPRTIEELIESC